MFTLSYIFNLDCYNVRELLTKNLIEQSECAVFVLYEKITKDFATLVPVKNPAQEMDVPFFPSVFFVDNV